MDILVTCAWEEKYTWRKVKYIDDPNSWAVSRINS